MLISMTVVDDAIVVTLSGDCVRAAEGDETHGSDEVSHHCRVIEAMPQQRVVVRLDNASCEDDYLERTIRYCVARLAMAGKKVSIQGSPASKTRRQAAHPAVTGFASWAAKARGAEAVVAASGMLALSAIHWGKVLTHDLPNPLRDKAAMTLAPSPIPQDVQVRIAALPHVEAAYLGRVGELTVCVVRPDRALDAQARRALRQGVRQIAGKCAVVIQASQ